MDNSIPHVDEHSPDDKTDFYTGFSGPRSNDICVGEYPADGEVEHYIGTVREFEEGMPGGYIEVVTDLQGHAVYRLVKIDYGISKVSALPWTEFLEKTTPLP